MTDQTPEQSVEPIVEPANVDNSAVQPQNFLDSLPEELRGESSLQDIKDVSGLAKSYVNAQRMLGGSVRIPGEDASDEAKAEFLSKLEKVPGVMRAPNPEDAEAMNSFYNSMGRPQTSGEYKIETNEHVNVNEEALGQFNELAHNLGLTQSQYEGVMNQLVNERTQEAQMIAESQAAGIDKMKEVWGNDYNTRIEAAQTVLSSYEEKYPEEVAALMQGANRNNPVLLSLLAEVAPTFQEKGVIGGQSKFQFGISKEEAMEKIVEIRNNPAHPANPLNNSGDKDAKLRYQKLYQIAYGE